MGRPYHELVERLSPDKDRTAAMQRFVDLVWDEMAQTGISWIGFYLHHGGDELILGPRRDKPACSPIGMHGACGKSFTTRQPLIVRDVAELGANYIACDPRDRSEVVIPLLDLSGQSWGVLDLDSYEVGAFDQSDVAGLTMLLTQAGLTQ